MNQKGVIKWNWEEPHRNPYGNNENAGSIVRILKFPSIDFIHCTYPTGPQTGSYFSGEVKKRNFQNELSTKKFTDSNKLKIREH